MIFTGPQGRTIQLYPVTFFILQTFEKGKQLFTKIFEVDTDGKITEEQIKKLPRENLKILGRGIDAPHGPVLDDEDDDALDDNDLDTLHDKDEL